jgi:Superinfection exclusion gene product 17
MEKEGSLRVWWIPQVPMKAFCVPVDSVEQGRFLLRVLADYDIFQFENRIKPDYSNVGGMECFTDGEWCEWENEDGENIDYAPVQEEHPR